MPSFRQTCVLVLLTTGFTMVTNAQGKANADKPFPTDDEINLVVTQAERAIQQYKPLIEQETIQMGKNYKEASVTDRQVVGGLELAIKTFKAKPQGFNSPLGFAFFEWLDDAERNALLCGSGASSEGALSMMDGKLDRAKDLLHLSQTCGGVASLIYTVSENAASLYTKYVEAEAQLAEHGAESATKCMDILKRLPPKK